ncbi:ATP-grasp domain-containing protein [Lysobacter brunescens]|uniref:RimK family alpha-L-glutamate ligase n=1 Tax=Lysobacter brunescens TaxID=262323 RepID=A0ABW2YEN7_9GAMM
MQSRILIVTHRGDIHADLVQERLLRRGERPFRLNLDEFPAQYRVDLAFDGLRWCGMLARRDDGSRILVDGIHAVWTRKTADFAFAVDLGVQERAYATGETSHILSGLLHGLEAYWMSHPSAVRAAQWKGEQLARAARMGFRVPPSLISDDKSAVLAFREAMGGDIVFKTMESPFLAADEVEDDERVAHGIGTTRIEAGHEGMLDAVSALPCFFQRHVPKRHEVRATVIGNRLFAARIHSQDDERTRVDFRNYDAPVRYEAARLPEEVERRCLAFVHSYGLTYGAIDLIVDHEDEYVFLENNPGGQFLFVEQRVPALAMLDAVADCLRAGADARTDAMAGACA